MKKPLLTGALLALMPVAALLPGCGGGNGGIVTPTAVPTVTPIPTTTGTPNATTTGTPGATATQTPEPTATSTPFGTPLPTSTPVVAGAVKPNLTFTPSVDSNFKSVPISSAGLNLNTSGGTNVLEFNADSTTLNYEDVILSGRLLGAGQGNGYSANSAASDTIQIRNDVVENNASQVRTYRFESGTITITKFSKSNTTISFNNVVFAAETNSGATGTVRVNGTITGPYTNL